MKYKHVVEEKEFKFGPKENLKSLKQAREEVRRVRCQVLTRLSLAGYSSAIEYTQEEETKDSIKLIISILYPVKLFEA